MKKYIVKLKKEEKKSLESIIKSGTHKVREVRHAQVLLKANKGFTDKQISEHVGYSINAIHMIRKLFCTEGLERVLKDAPRSGKPKGFTEKQDVQIVALACTTPPEGYSTWTLALLCKEAKNKKIVKSIGRKTVWTRLHQYNVKPWQKNSMHAKAR